MATRKWGGATTTTTSYWVEYDRTSGMWRWGDPCDETPPKKKTKAQLKQEQAEKEALEAWDKYDQEA